MAIDCQLWPHYVAPTLKTRIGIHCSTQGSLENAALDAYRLGANCFQIFSSSPRMWRARVHDKAEIAKLNAARKKFTLHPLVIHTSYLINLATLEPVIREKSIAAFRGELGRAVALDAQYLVIHPGNLTLPASRFCSKTRSATVLRLVPASKNFALYATCSLVNRRSESDIVSIRATS